MRRYDQYKPSGVEWIGEIPAHWSLNRLKYEVGYKKGKNPKDLTFDENGKVYLTMEYLRNNPKQTFFVEDHENYVTVDEGEILLLWDGSNAGEFIKSKEGVLASTMASLEICNQEIDYAWFFFKVFERQLKETTIGMGVPHVSGEEFKNQNFIIPPKSEQTAIANFLDEKTTKIDTLVANKQKLIELLKEERTAIINQAVTRGIDPSVQLKPSGISWLGDIPKHWEMKKLKYAATIFRGKFTHRPRNDERLYGGKYPFIQTGEVAKTNKYLIDYTQTLNEEGFQVTTQFPKGTLLMTIAANIGEVAILGIDACFPDSIVGFYPDEAIGNEFLFYKLKSLKDVFISTSVLNTQLNLNVDRISVIPITFPKLDEQQLIVRHIETEINRIDNTISTIKKEIELLQDYHTALISEVVTGKIKVT